MANLGSIIAQPTGFTLATIAMHDSRMAAYSTTVAVKQSSSKHSFVIRQWFPVTADQLQSSDWLLISVA